jgi:hypothetical protein
MFPARLPIPHTLTERFENVILLARHALADAQARAGLDTAIAWLINDYLMRLRARFARLVERANNGTLTPPRQRKPPAEGAPKPPRRQREKPLIRMSGAGWIVRRAQRAVVAGSRLKAMLDDPEMIRLLGLDPRFGAMLRPLCVALSAHPDPGQLPPAPPRAPRARREAKPKPPKPPRKPRAKKVRWWCAKPPRAGLIFSDESLN